MSKVDKCLSYLRDKSFQAIGAGPAAGPERTTFVKVVQGSLDPVIKVASLFVGTSVEIMKHRLLLDGGECE